MADSEEQEVIESETAKSTFLARMSHEMRTPLNAIIGMCTIAQNTAAIDRIASCLVKINEASIHLLGMINDVLDLAKIEEGNLELTNTEFNLSSLLQKTVDFLKFSLDAKKQILKLDLDPALPETIIADQQRLAQVLDNLLSNAVKFTPPEGIIGFAVKKKCEENKKCTLLVQVADTGIGIPKEALKKIFAPFEQLDGSTARKHEGAGIGLVIASSIIRLMGGELKVDSEPGKGSTFSFEITLETVAKKTEEAQSPGGAEGVSGPDEKHKFAGKTILLAEDVEINREIVISLLEDTGVAIDCAENGLQAVEKYCSDPLKYSLILMDVHMPEMDGYEATRQIRDFEHGPAFVALDKKSAGNVSHVPIIAMTANIFKDDVDKCLAVGMTDHLGKPVDIEELMKHLDKFLLHKP